MVEPEWDDEQRQLILDLFDYERLKCPVCHGHYDKTHDKNLARRLGEGKDICWDCYSIEKQMEVHHASHSKDACDCHEWRVWVEAYDPIPPR